MSYSRLILVPMVIYFLFGCTHVQFIRSGNGTTIEYPPTLKESVDIYRSTEPAWHYSEIGILTLVNVADINKIFEIFRAEAANKGANAIVKFDFDSESKIVTNAHLKTDSEGNSFWVYEDEREVTFTSSGTLVRKK